MTARWPSSLGITGTGPAVKTVFRYLPQYRSSFPWPGQTSPVTGDDDQRQRAGRRRDAGAQGMGMELLAHPWEQGALEDIIVVAMKENQAPGCPAD